MTAVNAINSSTEQIHSEDETDEQPLLQEDQDTFALFTSESPVLQEKPPLHIRFAWVIALATLIIVLATLFGVGAWYYLQIRPLSLFDHTIILVSFDGFRAEYLSRGLTPTFQKLIDEGVSVKQMQPCFPSKTFPNHYSIVTGLYPESHGIVANTFYDPVFNATFSITDSTTTSDARWWGGEPIWNTVVKAGKRAACFFWPGSEAPIQGIRPTFYTQYNGSIPNSQRVSQVLDWLALPYEERPVLITVYFSLVDDAGHAYGPDAPQLNTALQVADETLALLVDGIQRNHYAKNHVNLVIVSDHGMTGTSQQRVLFLDDYINLNDVQVIEYSPIASLIPNDGLEEQIYQQLLNASAQVGHFNVYWKNGSPEQQPPTQWYYQENIRITPINVVMELGWSMSNRAFFSTNPGYYNGGSHGYDNELTDMQAIFIASGPMFKKGILAQNFANIELYNLFAQVLSVSPAPNNGTENSLIIEEALV